MKLFDLVRKIESRIPTEWSESWDNVGLLAGDREWEIDRIAVSLDASVEGVEKAYKEGFRLIVTHHPTIFRPLERVTYDRLDSRIVATALRHGVALYAAHTNWDSSPRGVNVCLAAALGLEEVRPLVSPEVDGAWGMGAIGLWGVDEEAPLFSEALERVLNRLGLTWARGYGELGRAMRTVAVLGGSGGDLWKAARDAGADLYVSADIGYHALLEMRAEGMSVIVCDHGEMESVSLPALCRELEGATGLPAAVLAGANRGLFPLDLRASGG